MKTMLAVALLLITLSSCNNEPEFYLNGKPYYTRQKCVRSHLENKPSYHFGCYIGGCKWHWNWQCFSSCKETVCDEYKTDTIEIVN